MTADSLEPDQYTRLRVLLSEMQSEIGARLSEAVSSLRADIRGVASQVEHFERTSEMRFKGVQETQTRQAAEIGDLRAGQAGITQRVESLERARERTSGKEEGGDRTRQQLYAALSAIVALLAIVAWLAGQVQGATP